MSKVQQVMEHIRDNYSDWKLSGDAIWRIAAECECAPSTVYRAVKKLREMNMLDKAGHYKGRGFCSNAVYDYIKSHAYLGDFLLTDEKRQMMAKFLFTTERYIAESIFYLISTGDLVTPGGNVYGWRLRLAVGS